MILLDKIKKGENKILEFKEKLPSNDSIVKTTVSFSNICGGQLILGVNDKREIVGIDNDDIFKIQDKIASVIYDNCYPHVIPEIYTVNIEGKILIVVEIVKGSLLPYYIKSEGKNNGTYIRIGATNRKAGFENLLELERQKRNISFDEELDYGVDIGNINLEPIKNEFLRLNKEFNHEKMLNLKLIKNENGKIYPSRALLILLGYYENVKIKCSRFKGKTMDIFLDKKDYEGDLFSQMRNAEIFVLNHISIRAEIKGLQRKEVPEIPLEAIREAIVNAFVHRDYSNMGRDLKLGVYDDIVNIVSPGSFPNNILEDDILNGRSEIRNRVVARVFKELGYIEQWGSGIKRIKSFCLSAGLKEPVVQERNDFVDVELYRYSNQEEKNHVIATESLSFATERPSPATESLSFATERLSPATESPSFATECVKNGDCKIIIDFLLIHKSLTKSDVKDLLNVKDTKAKEILNKMIHEKIIQRIDSGKNTHYKLLCEC